MPRELTMGIKNAGNTKIATTRAASDPNQNFTDYLIPLDKYPDVEAKIISKVKEVEGNPFHEPTPGEKVRHYILSLTSQYRYVEEDCEPSKWIDGHPWGNSYPLKFYWSGSKAPTMGRFSKHIWSECNAALRSFDRRSGEYVFHSRCDISMMNVWRFTKLQRKDYSQTEDFIRDYDYWESRLYNTQKWFFYMTGDLEWIGGCISLGEAMYEFLGIEQYNPAINA